MLNKTLITAVTLGVTLFVAACKSDEKTACTQDDLNEKTAQFMAAIQANPAKAADMTKKMQEFAPRLAEIAASGQQPDQGIINEMCETIDSLVAEVEK